ncbi:thiamine pyrophosphate-binding protein, partial [Candidatus Microgenomates bacterium]
MNNKVKLSDFIVSYLVSEGITDAFMIVGGGAMHLNDSFGRNPKMKYYCNHHEQASAMAAEGYARLKNKIGLCVVTTGPGGANTINGLAGSWLDSIPVLYISGQVKLETTIGNSKLRQVGLQELPIVEIVKPITKYAVMVTKAEDIKYHLQKALYIAKSGRPGPVWLDIPLDIQSSFIEPEKIKSFDEKELAKDPGEIASAKEKISKVADLLKKSKRPVIIAGNGIRLSGAREEFLKLIEKINVPVVTATNAHDLIPSSHPLFFGRPGLFGERVGNFVVANSDLLITIGSQLSIWTVTFGYKTFAREAFHVRVDIDENELNKKTIKQDITICLDAKDFIEEINKEIKKNDLPNYIDWLKYCKKLKRKYPVVLPRYKKQKRYVNSYFFVDVLSDAMKDNEVVVVGNGTAFTCTFQSMKLKKNQRLIGNVNHASMGYDLPASIGACIANNKKQVVCITGDGSIQMNIQELETIKFNKLPIKVFLINNNGYLAIRNTQDSFFKSHYVGTDFKSGVDFPDILKVAKAYGIPAIRIKNQRNLKEKIKDVLSKAGPMICEIMMDPRQPLIPKVSSFVRPDGKLISKPMEDMYPFLEREEFYENM